MLRPRRLPDAPFRAFAGPWFEYTRGADYFGIISNTAGGYSFYRDARLRRLTRYRYNNAPFDLGGVQPGPATLKLVLGARTAGATGRDGRPAEGYELDDEVAKYLPKYKNPVVISTFNEADASFETRPAKMAPIGLHVDAKRYLCAVALNRATPRPRHALDVRPRRAGKGDDHDSRTPLLRAGRCGARVA